jgi:hypothetical protein
LAIEGGHGLAALDHDRRGLTAATTLSHNFRRQFQDRLIDGCYSLIGLGSELGLAEWRRATSYFHRRNTFLGMNISVPILFFEPSHGRRVRVLDFEHSTERPDSYFDPRRL